MYGGFVIVAFYRRQKARGILDRVMRLEIRRLIRDEAVSECMALIECVISEATNNVEQFLT